MLKGLITASLIGSALFLGLGAMGQPAQFSFRSFDLPVASGAAFTQIDFPGDDVVSTQARGIEPAGNIVGFYVSRDSSGVLHEHGFVATRTQGQDKTIILR